MRGNVSSDADLFKSASLLCFLRGVFGREFLAETAQSCSNTLYSNTENPFFLIIIFIIFFVAMSIVMLLIEYQLCLSQLNIFSI